LGGLEWEVEVDGVGGGLGEAVVVLLVFVEAVEEVAFGLAAVSQWGVDKRVLEVSSGGESGQGVGILAVLEFVAAECEGGQGEVAGGEGSGAKDVGFVQVVEDAGEDIL